MRTYLKVMVCGCLLALCSFAACAEENLLSTYNKAMQSDPTLKSAASRRDAQATLLPQARGALLPQLDVALSQSRSQVKIPTPGFSSRVSENHGISLNLEQILLNFGAWYGYKQANKLKNQAYADYRASEHDLMIRVADAYFALLKAKDNLYFIRAEKDAIGKQLEQTQEQFNVGLVAITDVKEAQARYDATLADEIRINNELADRKAELQEIIGEQPKKIAPLQETIVLGAPVPDAVASWVDVALTHNPTLIATQFAADAAHDNVKVVQSEHWPEMKLSGGLGQQRLGSVTTPDSSYGDTWSVTLSLDMNLFSGGRIAAQVDNARFTYREARHNLDKARRDVISKTSIAYRGVLTAIGQVKALRQAVISAQTALEATQAAYDVGSRTSVDLLDSIFELYKSQQRLASARYDYILNQLRLKQVAGVLHYADLEQINDLLQIGDGASELPAPT